MDLSVKDITVLPWPTGARERGMGISEVVLHDLLTSSPLFDGDLPEHANKSQLISEAETALDLTT